MGRFLAIVIALVAIALVINSLQKDKPVVDEPKLIAPEQPTEPAEKPSEVADEGEKAISEELAEIDPAVEETTAPAAAAESSEAEAPAPAAPGPAAPGPESPAETAGPTASAVEAKAEKAAAVAAADEAINEVIEEEPVDDKLKGVALPDATKQEQVMLGGSELLVGIPGEGDLTEVQIEQWLADPANRVVLKPELPLGLAAGVGQIKGLDESPLTRAKIELGRQLYFDTRLSADNSISCATCHDPEVGYAKETQFGVGIKSQTGNRNSPTAYNRILSGAQFWDGRATSLEDQAIGPIANPIEMGNTHEVCVKSVAEIPGYRKQFDAIFADGLSIENIGKAIAAFERTLVTGPAPWDYYQQLASFEKAYAADIEDLELLQEEDEELYNEYMAMKKASEEHPISESAIRGGELFFSDKAACTTCHVGANFSDELYHNLGVGMDAEKPDLGRYEQTGEEKDKGAFKTPTVRNISLTGPYMHDGSQKTLEEVVEWYAKGGHPNPYLSDKIKKLDLTEQDKADLVAFMKEGLHGTLPQPERGRLPK
jgi:cytochrome c peroxidase